ncbi:UBP1-associated protein 2A-like isoform X2 [Argentina anserina]|nr:UBP1-associated protein 2A-like isoform X2 [Potentilla anserina]
MGKIQTTKKRRLVKTADKNLDKTPTTPKLEPKPQQPQPQPQQNDDVQDLPHKQPHQTGSGSDSDSDSDSESLSQLLEPFSKEELISLITSAASADRSLCKRIRRAADADVSHRKIFVHGLGWDTNAETLAAAFAPFGEVEDSNLVMDRITGKTKGYGFVLFKTRRAALDALKDPKKSIGNRTASCQLASVGPGTNSNSNTAAQPSSSSSGHSDIPGRKIYVSGVPHDADADKLKALFAKFGEIETGPMGFDSQTGKCRGFALFLYKTVDGAKKALEEPVKVFEGQQLNCQKAAEGSKNKNNNNAAAPPQQQMQTPPLAAVPGAQNLAFFGQYPGFNPMYGGLMTNIGAALVPGAGNMIARPLNPGLLAGALSTGVFPAGQYGQVAAGGFGGVSHGMGSFGAGGSLLGSYGSIAPIPTMQGLQQVYPGSQTGQTATVRPQGTSGYQPYL